MLVNVSHLIHFRELLQAWTGRIVRTRYQQSLLGGLWIIAQPVATVVIFTVIFSYFMLVDTGDVPYILFSYTALVPWMLLANGLTDMTNSVVDNMNLVTKIYFPREILPLSALLARLLDFLIAASLLVILMLYFRVPIFSASWLYLPVILTIQLTLMVGLGLLLAASNVFYRDVKPLLTLGIQLWFYVSPIIYTVKLVPEWLRPFYSLNPMAGVLEAYRAVLLYRTMPGSDLLISGLIATLILIVGYWFFKHVEFQFADIV